MKRTNLHLAVLAACSLSISGACFAAERAAAPPPSDTVPHSDRDQMKATSGDKDALEKALKVGQGKDFYRQELQKMGYVITSVNHDKADYLEYEIVKGTDSYEVQIDFDSKTAKAKKVDVTANAWKHEATERALRGDLTSAVRK